MKKTMFVLAGAALLALAGCSQGGRGGQGSTSKDTLPPDTSTESTSSSTDDGTGFIKTPVSITLSATLSYEDQINSFIESFKKVEPNVTVTYSKESTNYDGLKDKIVDGIAVNNYADMAVLYPDAIGTLMDYNIVTALDSYMENEKYGLSEADIDDIVPAYLEEGKKYAVPGTYSLPFCKSTEAMFYNKGILVGLNLSAQDPTINGGNALSEDYLDNLTWDELFDKLCPALIAYNDAQDADHKIIKDHATYSKAVIGYDSDDNLFITLAQQYGYGYTSLDQVTGEGKLLFNVDDIDSNGDGVNDTNGMKELIKKFKKAYDKGYLITKGSSNGGNYTNYSFTNGAALFSVGSTGGVKYQQKDGLDVGVARIPQAPVAEGHVNAFISQGPSIALLNHKDQNKTLASWLFYKHMINEKNSLKWSLDTNYSPIRYSNLESGDYMDATMEDDLEIGSLDMVKARAFQYVGRSEVSSALFTSPVFKGSDVARTQVGSLVTTLLKADPTAFNDALVNAEFAKAENNVKTKM